MKRLLLALSFVAGCSQVDIVDQGGGGGEANTGGSGGGAVVPATTEVTVEVVDERGLPGANLDVLSHTAGGTLSAGGVTGADGRIVIAVPTDGLVSVLFDRHEPLLDHEERYIQSVKLPAGRTDLRLVTFQSQPDDDTRPPMGPINVDVGPASSFWIGASCASAPELMPPLQSNIVTLENYRGCAGVDVFDIFAYRITLSDEDGFVVTDVAAIMGQPFTPGEGADLSLEWEPVSPEETVWQLSGVSDPIEKGFDAWQLAKQPYLFIREPMTLNEVGDDLVQQSTPIPADLKCLSHWFGEDGSSYRFRRRTVCGETAPANISWAVDRLATPIIDSSAEQWAMGAGELGDYFDVRTTWAADDGALVSWSLLVSSEVASRPLDLELNPELALHFGPAADTSPTVSVTNVDVDGAAGFDEVLDVHGAVPTLPGARELSRELVMAQPLDN
ncbi:MAG: hypothetical protein JNK04_18410 [Myxococcales bacterium]|nr:hypothetical protein [Myxococcales bacterium]